MKKTKKKKFLIRRIVAIIIIFSIILGIRNLSYFLSEKSEMKQTRLLFNHDFVKLINHIYAEDSSLYISLEDIQNIFDETIYYNVGDKELITTYNKHVAVLHLNETQMIVNDVEFTMQGTLKEIDSKIYLPISDLGMVYDVETEFVSQTNMVMMDSTTKAKKQVVVLDDAKIKLNKNPFSLTVQKVNRGDELVVIEESGRYKKVRTAQGKIGYIKTKKISEEEILREDWIEEKLDASEFEDMNELFLLTKEQANIKNVSSSFATYSLRNDIIKNVYNQVMQNQYKGVYIDFQEIDDVNSFYRFLIELSPKFKESGLKVAVKVNQQLDKKRIKNIVDFTIE